MKNLLNCHTVGLHSFPVSLENNLYRRIFYADNHHHLWKPINLAVHPHHVDIKITVLEGVLYNQLFEVSQEGAMFKKFNWNSHILNGKGGFEFLGEERLDIVSTKPYKPGETTTMNACELHTVFVEKGKICVWLIEESIASCDSFPVNYALTDLTKWTPEGLYVEVGDHVKDKYIGKYLKQL